MPKKEMDNVTDETLMPFGKYKGQKLANVPAGYLWWLYEDISSRQPKNIHITDDQKLIKKYVEDNLQAIKQELNK